MTLKAVHPSDGSDDQGSALPLVIRIGPDGLLYFHDITLDLLPVALALCPDDKGLLKRQKAAEAFVKESK